MLAFCSNGNGKDINKANDEYDQLPRLLRFRLRFAKKKTEAHDHYTIIRLGSKRLLKKGCGSTEYEALRFVDLHTSIPIPKVLGVYNLRDGLLVELETVPGRSLDDVWHELSQSQKKRIVEDVSRFIDQLRKMKPLTRPVVGSASHGASFDHRFGKGSFGPFYSVGDFHDFIRRGHPIEDFEEDELRRCHGSQKPYELKFTHGLISPRNILVDDSGRTAAILDWESAGWYPEYWEYTQMHFATPKGMRDWLEDMRRVMVRYDEEVLAEEALRKRYCGSIYDCARSVRKPSMTASELQREQEEVDLKNTESTSG